MPNISEEGRRSPSHSTLACYMCRKRKIKCGRELPHCTICKETSQECSYPAKPLRPGPKIGSTHASSQKRQLERESQEKSPRAQRNVRTEPPRTPQGTTVGESTPSSAAPVAPQSPARPNDVLSLSFIIHPTFENCSPEQTDAAHDFDDTDSRYVYALMTSCNWLGLTLLQLNKLLTRYFETFTSFQLFRLTELQAKLRNIPTAAQRTALLAAMLAFGLKGLDHSDVNNMIQDSVFSEPMHPPSIHFRALSIKYMEQAVDELEDEPLSLPLLQAMILNTHCLLVQGVRGRAWRYLGTLIRAAYELNLHLIDAGKPSHAQPTNAERWCIEEEWRRAWWAIWEMDVFASVIRRCPTGIDWTQNDTFLPAEDEKWYHGEPQPGCFLENNVNSRWKSLAATQGQSPRAWFIVINSLMKDAQNLSSPTSVDRSLVSDPAPTQASEKRIFDEHQRQQTQKKAAAVKQLSTVLNALYCAVLALPKELKYHGQHLNFGGADTMYPAAVAQRLTDSFVYSIYLMTQLTKLMVLKYHVFRSGVKWNFGQDHNNDERIPTGGNSDPEPPRDSTLAIEETQHLAQYFDAADSVMNMIRACAEDHYQHVNPFLASTTWLAGAVQLLHRSRLPEDDPDRELITSRYDLLNLTYQKTVDFWNMSKVPLRNWETLESCLEGKSISNDKNNPSSGGNDGFHLEMPYIFTAGNVGLLNRSSPSPPSSSSSSSLQRKHSSHREPLSTSSANGNYTGVSDLFNAPPATAAAATATAHYPPQAMSHYAFLTTSSSSANLYAAAAATTSPLLEHSHSQSNSQTQQQQQQQHALSIASSEPDLGAEQHVASFPSTETQVQFSPAFLDPMPMSMPFAVDRHINTDFSNYLDEMLSGSYLP